MRAETPLLPVSLPTLAGEHLTPVVGSLCASAPDLATQAKGVIGVSVQGQRRWDRDPACEGQQHKRVNWRG